MEKKSSPTNRTSESCTRLYLCLTHVVRTERLYIYRETEGADLSEVAPVSSGHDVHSLRDWYIVLHMLDTSCLTMLQYVV